MATLTINRITELGLTGSLESCATGGDNFLNSGIEFIRVVNQHGSQAYNVTCPLAVPFAVEVIFFLFKPVVSSIPVAVVVFVRVQVVAKDNSSVSKSVLLIVIVAVVVAIFFYFMFYI